jgi:hypothetical protein
MTAIKIESHRMENAILAEEYGDCHRSTAFGRYVEVVVVLVLLRLLDQ